MKKVFTLFAAVAMAMPMLSAAEKTVTIELCKSGNVVATLADQKISYNESTDSYTLENFLGWNGANLAFTIVDDPTSPTNEGRHFIHVHYNYDKASDNKTTTEMIVHTDNKMTLFKVNTTDWSSTFTGETDNYRIQGGSTFNANTDHTDGTKGWSYNWQTGDLIANGDQTGSTWATIDNGIVDMTMTLGMTGTVQRDDLKSNNWVAGGWAMLYSIKLSFPEKLEGGAVTPEPGEGNTTFELWSLESVAGSKGYDYPANKLGSAKGNVSYDETTGEYTLENFLGYNKADVKFTIDAEAQTKGDQERYTFTLKNPVIAGNATVADLDNIVSSNNTLIAFVLNPNLGVSAQVSPMLTADNNDLYRSVPFMGSENDYILMRPTISISKTAPATGAKWSYILKENGKSTLYLKATSRGYFTKAAGAEAWGDFQTSMPAYYIVCELPGDNKGGVEGIEIEDNNDAPVEYYNLQGVRVENPAAGLYIRRQGNKVQKVVIR